MALIPMLATFDIVKASMSSGLGITDGSASVVRTLSLTLVFDLKTRITLEGGRPLSGVQVDFSLREATNLPDADIAPTELGFLCQMLNSDGSPQVHGAAIWPPEFDPAYLVISPHLRRGGSLTIATLETIPEYAPPFAWKTYREHALRISRMSFYASVADVIS